MTTLLEIIAEILEEDGHTIKCTTNSSIFVSSNPKTRQAHQIIIHTDRIAIYRPYTPNKTHLRAMECELSDPELFNKINKELRK